MTSNCATRPAVLPGQAMNELALFAGAGGGILGGALLGWRTVCAVECNAYAASVLVARQNDGILPPFPVWDDVRTFDGQPWRGIVDVVSGGFPCQDISAAGKGAGIDGERSGLWGHMARIVGEVRPRHVFVENSPLLVGRGLVRVLADLAEMGFDARWGVVGAADVGAPHGRDRLWLVANADQDRCEWQDVLLQPRRQDQGRAIAAGRGQVAAYTCGHGLEGPIHMGHGAQAHGDDARCPSAGGTESQGWQGDHPEPGILGVDDGMADWKHRIAALGNGQVPLVAATAWRLLT